ncbi:YafY family protein [Streptomyces sp. G1]|uniref:helix-turn-helix transcriptional regulator n=1 Tax=Streptomyces sp. G1 TaxID=361572 RepID=UPI00202EBFB5|nr:YafY family protein [Streptomyces sp. G1]MCM1971491.1 YafY family transcriptional regulator [Streptomyces sp. G1]
MSDTPARLLQLLSLLQAPREWPGHELADRLDVSPRTIRRDIDRLRELGYPVHATQGNTGGYRLTAGTAMPPLLLDDDEAVAIAIGLRTAAAGSVTGIEETSVRALAKLEQVLPSRLRRRVTVLQEAAVAVPQSGPTADAEHLALIAAACVAHEKLRFTYRAGTGAETRRLVEPHQLVAAGRRWYLVAYDTDRADWRTFRLDRLADPFRTGSRVPPRELPGGADAATWVARTLTGTEGHRALLLVHAPAEQVADRVPAGLGIVEPVDDHTCRLLTGADSLEYLAYRIAVLGHDFDVLDPPELATHLRTLGERVLRAAATAEQLGAGE